MPLMSFNKRRVCLFTSDTLFLLLLSSAQTVGHLMKSFLSKLFTGFWFMYQKPVTLCSILGMIRSFYLDLREAFSIMQADLISSKENLNKILSSKDVKATAHVK